MNVQICPRRQASAVGVPWESERAVWLCTAVCAKYGPCAPAAAARCVCDTAARAFLLLLAAAPPKSAFAKKPGEKSSSEHRTSKTIKPTHQHNVRAGARPRPAGRGAPPGHAASGTRCSSGQRPSCWCSARCRRRQLEPQVYQVAREAVRRRPRRRRSRMQPGCARRRGQLRHANLTASDSTSLGTTHTSQFRRAGIACLLLSSRHWTDAEIAQTQGRQLHRSTGTKNTADIRRDTHICVSTQPSTHTRRSVLRRVLRCTQRAPGACSGC